MAEQTKAEPTKAEPSKIDPVHGAKAGAPEVHASPTTVKIGDRTYEVRQLVWQDFGTLMRKALEEYKFTLASGLKRLEGVMPPDELKSERAKIMRLDHLDLPTKTIMLDRDGEVTEDQDACETKVRVDYWRWWADHTYEGNVHLVWLSLRKAQPEVTVDYVEQKIMGLELNKLAAIVADVSKQTVGNAETATPGA